ncbi:hypothetical protein ABPG75_001572 [Micractinium tetrahymenae]
MAGGAGAVAASKGAVANGDAGPSKPGTSGPSLTRVKTAAQARAALEAAAEVEAQKSIPGSAIFKAAFAGWVGLVALFIKLLKLVSWELVFGGACGVGFGVLLAAWYRLNRQRKDERRQLLGVIPGAKGMQELLHHIPTWISFRETEKMEWLNRILEKVWPYYDEAICKLVKEQVEPLMMQYKPPGLIKKIYFQKLTFGDDPFRVEGIRVDKDTSDGEICIEVDYRWAGDANIFLAIELPAGGQATRMVPKVSNLAVSGTLRVILKPLLPEVPGFGAAVVSLRKPPIVRFNLNFGKSLGGGYSAGAIKAWLDPFLRETMCSMLLWPRRLVIPILPEEVTGPLDDLYLRHRGALQVDVVEAKNLPRMDTVGTTDAFCELFTLVDPKKPDSIEKTKVIKNTLNPAWNERVWLMVQEPTTQFMYVECFDRDYLNAKELMRLNVFKGATSLVNAKELVGRCAIQVADLAEAPGQAVDKWVPLGRGEFANEDGCGGGYGELHLRLTYWPFQLLSGHVKCRVGTLLITLHSCADLPPADLPIGSSDPYVEFRVGKDVRKAPVQNANLNPKWLDTKFDFFKIPSGETLHIKVFDYDMLSRDELLGTLAIDLLEEVQKAPGGDITKTWRLQNVATDWMSSSKEPPPPATISMRLQWIPFKMLGED